MQSTFIYMIFFDELNDPNIDISFIAGREIWPLI